MEQPVRPGRIAALTDAARPGRPRSVDDVEIVVRTLEPPPAKLGVTHWSSRLLAKELNVAPSTVVEVWRSYGLQPWCRESFKFSTDPQLETMIRDVVGPYLDPPENAIVLSVDEKSQCRALERSQPIPPGRSGGPTGQVMERSVPSCDAGCESLWSSRHLRCGGGQWPGRGSWL